MVRGLIICRKIISEKAYLEAFADGSVAARMRQLTKNGAIEPEVNNADNEENPFEYIHLKEARAYFAGPASRTIGVCCGEDELAQSMVTVTNGSASKMRSPQFLNSKSVITLYASHQWKSHILKPKLLGCWKKVVSLLNVASKDCLGAQGGYLRFQPLIESYRN
jgi:hypothetical protein